MTRRSLRRAYTIVEVVIAITLLTLGVLGIVGMQHYAAGANRNARLLATANQIARTTLERLRTDAASWNQPSVVNPTGNDLGTDTVWLAALNSVSTGSMTGWIRPKYDATHNWGAGFDALGNDIVEVSDAPVSGSNDTIFCMQYRLAWLYGPVQGAFPYLMRAEVRVFWPRENLGTGLGSAGSTVYKMSQYCTSATSADFSALDADTGLQFFHTVYVTGAIRENPPEGL